MTGHPTVVLSSPPQACPEPDSAVCGGLQVQTSVSGALHQAAQAPLARASGWTEANERSLVLQCCPSQAARVASGGPCLGHCQEDAAAALWPAGSWSQQLPFWNSPIAALQEGAGTRGSSRRRHSCPVEQCLNAEHASEPHVACALPGGKGRVGVHLGSSALRSKSDWLCWVHPVSVQVPPGVGPTSTSPWPTPQFLPKSRPVFLLLLASLSLLRLGGLPYLRTLLCWPA